MWGVGNSGAAACCDFLERYAGFSVGFNLVKTVKVVKVVVCFFFCKLINLIMLIMSVFLIELTVFRSVSLVCVCVWNFAVNLGRNEFSEFRQCRVHCRNCAHPLRRIPTYESSLAES